MEDSPIYGTPKRDELMKTGDIILFKPGGSLFSQIIAWGTRSDYCHVAVCVSPKMNLAIEANTTGGVRAIDISAINRDVDIFRVKENFDIEQVIAFLVSKLNSKYDILGVLYLGFLKFLSILKLPTKELANKWQKEKDYFCSELCAEAFMQGGKDIVPNIEDSEITAPGDIAKSPILERLEI